MVGFKKILNLIPLLTSFLYLEVFIPFKTGQSIPKTAYQEFVELFVLKLFPFIILIYVALNFSKLRSNYVLFFLLPLLYFIYLIFQSLYLYNSFIEFPHVFFKILSLMVTLTFFIFYQSEKHTPKIDVLFNIILISIFLKIAIDPSMINIQAFTSHKRGIGSESALLLVLPCLYFFNIYITEFKIHAFIKFLILLFFIVFFQHRSVWVAFVMASAFNLFVLNRQKVLELKKTLPSLLALSTLVILGTSLVITYDEEVLEKTSENIENIFNPSKEESTSAWRIEQMQSYWPYVKENIVVGMRLRGFELPVQFIRKGQRTPEFEEGTGHHFHSFYFDILFYFGLVGLILFISVMIQPILKIFKNELHFNSKELSFVSFIFAGFIYGITYNLPFYYWGILGLTLVYVNNKIKSQMLTN